MGWQQALQEYSSFLKEKHHLTDEDLRQALFSEQVPAEAFASKLTPLQTIAVHLRDRYGKTARETAKQLGRTTTEVEKFLEGAGDQTVSGTGTITVPVAAFKDRTYTASEHIVRHLQGQGLSVAEIARLIGKSQRTVWTLHYRAKQKGGERHG